MIAITVAAISGRVAFAIPIGRARNVIFIQPAKCSVCPNVPESLAATTIAAGTAVIANDTNTATMIRERANVRRTATTKSAAMMVVAANVEFVVREMTCVTTECAGANLRAKGNRWATGTDATTFVNKRLFYHN